MFVILLNGPYYNLMILFDNHLLKSYELSVTSIACTKSFFTTDDEEEVPIDWNPSNLKGVQFILGRFS
jgi:hypothetical protein